jgi:hypothetical protein
MSFRKVSPRPPPADSPSIEKKNTGIIVLTELIFSKALKIPRVFEKSISAPLVSPNPGVSQNRYRVLSYSNSTVEQNEVSDLENGLFLNLSRRGFLNYFTPI